jgi:hypothetical protein
MYEQIVLIGELRSGGKWLKSVFDPSHYMDLREFLSPLPQNGLTTDGHRSHVHAGHKLVDILVPILKYSNIDEKLVSAIHDVLVSLTVSDNGVINTRFSTLQICEIITKTMKKLNKGTIIKLLPFLVYDLKNAKSMNNFINNSNLCIKFYRKNILNLYISHMKSLVSGCWSNKESIENKINKNLIKIIWDENHYNDYYHSMVASFCKLIQNKYNNAILISYEQIHESGMKEKEKLEFLTDLIRPIVPNIEIISNSVLDSETKESKILKTEENFINQEAFLMSQNKIKIYLPEIV